MTRKRWIAGAVAIAALALVAAACGGGSSPAQTSNSAAPAAASATVDMASTGLGNVLVDSSGRTLYLFEKDANGSSSCSNACASNWPPLTATGAPSAGTGIDSAKLGTTARADGTMQVTYGGHPLYLFVGDAKAGDTKGEGISAFGADWYAVSPKGDSVEEKSNTAPVGGGY